MALIATVADELTPEFISEALGVEGAIRGVSATRIGTGQVALSLRLDLDLADGAPDDVPATLVAKIPSPDAESREAARMHLTYHKEVGFYRDVAGLVSVPHPHHRYAVIDAESGDFTMLMDQVRGEVGDQLAGCSVADAYAMTDAAVGLHAPTWGRANELANDTWLPVPDPSGAAMRQSIYSMLLAGFLDRFSDRLSSEVLDTARWLGSSLEQLLSSYRLPLCVVHGDYRLDNMLFDRSGDTSLVTVLDWQTAAFSRGPNDIAYGIGSGLLLGDRRSHESALVERYWSGLDAAGVTCLLDDVRHDYRIGTVTGFVMAVIASQVVTATERGDEMFAVMAERHAQQMLDNDVFTLVDGGSE
jgi:hypothetical protein